MNRNKRLHVSCSEDERKLLMNLAKEMGFSISQLVRWLVKQESERRGKNEQ